MCSLYSGELCGVGHTHFCSNFPFVKLQQIKNFFELLLGNLTDSHQTFHEASVDPTDKRFSKEF